MTPDDTSDSRIEAASAAEHRRIADLEAAFAGDDDFILLCIVKGWTAEDVRKHRDAHNQQPRRASA